MYYISIKLEFIGNSEFQEKGESIGLYRLCQKGRFVLSRYSGGVWPPYIYQSLINVSDFTDQWRADHWSSLTIPFRANYLPIQVVGPVDFNISILPRNDVALRAR